MRWPEACKLIERIKAERPELIVDSYSSGDHTHLRIYCILKNQPPDADGMTRRVIPESVDTIYGEKGWREYVRRHPEPWCRPEDSYHTDALGREVDHRGNPVGTAPPSAPAITAEAMLSRIIDMNSSDPDWWKDEAKVAEMAAAWGVRGNVMESEQEEVARVSGDCHASILIARTGNGLFTAHAGADLLTPRGILTGGLPPQLHVVQPPIHLCQCGTQIPFTLTPRGRLDDAGRRVDQPQAVLVLVAVLAALAGAAEPLQPELIGTADAGLDVERIEDGDSDGAGVNTSAPLGGRNALEAVAADLVVQAGKVLAFELEPQR